MNLNCRNFGRWVWKFSAKTRERLGYESSGFDPSFRSFTHSITGQKNFLRALKMAVTVNEREICNGTCLVPVRRFPSPSRSIRFGDVSEGNGWETPSHFRMDHVTRNALAARKNEA